MGTCVKKNSFLSAPLKNGKVLLIEHFTFLGKIMKKSPSLSLKAIFVGLLCAALAYSFMNRKPAPVCSQGQCLLVGTSDDFPPFSFNENGSIVGIDIDVVNEAARRLDKTVVLKNMNFDVLLRELQSGAIEAIACGMTPSEERKKRVLFTEPHLEGDSFVMVSLKNNLANSANPTGTVHDLVGKKVVVNEGYTADSYITQAGIDALRTGNLAEAFLALQTGKADVFVTAGTPLKPYFAQHSETDFTITPLTGTNESCALAVTKKNPELCDALNRVLQEMKEDGTMNNLKKKWGLN